MHKKTNMQKTNRYHEKKSNISPNQIFKINQSDL